MSLIADALKAAQGDKATARSGGGQSGRRAMAAAVLNRGDATPRSFAGTANRMPKSLGFATAVFACAIMVAAGVVALAPNGLAEPAAGKQVPDDADRSRSVLGTPRSQRVATIADEPSTAAVAEAEMEPDVAAQVYAASPLPAESRSPDRRAVTVPEPIEETVTPPTATRPVPVAAAAERLVNPGAPQPRPVASEPGRFQLTVEPARPASRDLISEAVAAHRRNDFATAIQLYQQALEQNPRNAQALVNLGTSYQAASQHGRARDAFRRALDLNPRDARAWSNLGAALGALGEVAEAQAALGEAIRLDPSNHGAKVNLANHFLARGIATDARRLFEEVVKDQPVHAEAQYGLGRALEALGDRNSAAAHYRKFLESASGRFPQLEVAVRQRIEQLSASSRR